MQDILTKLKQKLTRQDIDFRIGSLIPKGDKVYATILAYKDARTDMKILDEATGGMWQNEYRRDTKGVLQCGIGIKFEGEWIWKWSNGVESKTEKEKGEYSDAFKRAGFMWGIGRDLYDVPTLFITLKQGEFYKSGDQTKASNKLRPNDWAWEISDDMKTFKATDKDGLVRVEASEAPDEEETAETKAVPATKPVPQPPTPKVEAKTGSTETRVCVICGKEFTPDPLYPNSKTCSAKCGYENKLRKEKEGAAAKPMTNADIVPKEAPDDDIDLSQIPF